MVTRRFLVNGFSTVLNRYFLHLNKGQYLNISCHFQTLRPKSNRWKNSKVTGSFDLGN